MKDIAPVVKKNASFSILLLRNDSKVVRFRLNSFWVKFLAVFFVLFSGASGASGYAAHYYWKKYNTLQQERSELTEKLGENRRQLGRFAGIERMKETLPRTTMTGVATVAPHDNGQSTGQTNGSSPQGDNGAQTASGPVDGARTAAQGAVSSSDPPAAGTPASGAETQNGGEENPAAGSGTPAASGNDTARSGDPAEPAAAGPQTADSPGTPPPDPNHPALIDKAQIRSAGTRTFRLTYELSNQERERESQREEFLSLSGKVGIAVVSKTGTRHDITSTSGDSLRFVIKWGKKVDVSFSLPADAEVKDMATLLLTVDAENLPPVTYSFPIPQA